jgi:hypothetical protein
MDDCDAAVGTALEMIKRFRSEAAQIARDFAEIAEERHNDHLSARAWIDIADAIERLSATSSPFL